MTEWQPSFLDLPALDAIGRQIADAAVADEQRRRGFRLQVRPSLRSLLLAAILLIALVGTAAGGTLLVLRGSVIPAPSASDVPPEQTPVPSSAKVAPERAGDPGSAPPWALRISRSRTGFLCSTVGQVVRGQFGLVGLDGRFRRLAVGIVDGCGQEQSNAASLVGARVFDARRASDVRTVVNGIGGPDLRRVTVEAAGDARQVHVGAGGVFITALRGYPEDLGVRVSLRFADGHVEDHPFGANPLITIDPAGGRAWRLQIQGTGRPFAASCREAMRRGRPCPPDNTPVKLCASFRPAREMLNQPSSENVCGYLGFRQPRTGPQQRVGYFFGVRRETSRLRAAWKNYEPRTAVFGIAGDDVKRIEVDGPGGTRQAPVSPRQGFLMLYGPAVVPQQLTVRVTFHNGNVETHHGDANLIGPGRR